MSAPGGARRLGLFGKMPAHGDFVRRGDLPASFCAPWDAWLQAGIAAARAAIGEERWESVWDAAPAWRFALPAGACGPDAAAGVLLPSRDAVGRRFPLTLAAVREGSEGEAEWLAAWFAVLEGVGRDALALGQDADTLAALLPEPEAGRAAPEPAGEAPLTEKPLAEDPLAAFWASISAENALAQALDAEGPPPPAGPQGVAPEEPEAAPPAGATAADDTRVPLGWWTAAAADGTPGLVWPLPALPAADEFVLLLEAEA